MPKEPAEPIEHVVPITLLRGSLGFAYRTVAETGEPVIVQRYSKRDVIVVPLAEWRALKRLESVVRESLPKREAESRDVSSGC